jgi:hypothetical protein
MRRAEAMPATPAPIIPILNAKNLLLEQPIPHLVYAHSLRIYRGCAARSKYFESMFLLSA